jgi:hypothetical protein
MLQSGQDTPLEAVTHFMRQVPQTFAQSMVDRGAHANAPVYECDGLKLWHVRAFANGKTFAVTVVISTAGSTLSCAWENSMHLLRVLEAETEKLPMVSVVVH